MSAAAVIFIRRKKFIRRFAEKGATSPDRAIAVGDTGMRRSWIFDQMVARGVFVPERQDRFFLDPLAAAVFLREQRRRARRIGGILLVLFIIFVAGSLLLSR